MVDFAKGESSVDLFDVIAEAVAQAFDDEGGRIVADVKDRLSVSIGYAIGPNGGTYVIRSVPGEPPRKETGALQESIEHVVMNDSDSVLLEVSAATPYAPRLDPAMRRLIFTGIDEEYDEVLLAAAQQAVERSHSF